MPTASFVTVAPGEEPPGEQTAGKRKRERKNVSTSEPDSRQLFNFSSIDWNDDAAIDQAARLIWVIATAKGEDNQ